MIFSTGGARQRGGRKLGSGPSVTYNRVFRSLDKILSSRGVPISSVSSGSSNSRIQKQQLPRRIFGSTYQTFAPTLALSLLFLALCPASAPYAYAQQEAAAQTGSETTPQVISEIRVIGNRRIPKETVLAR